MNNWSGLMKKEFRLGFPVFLVVFAIYVVSVVGAYYIGYHMGYAKIFLFSNSLVTAGVHTLILTFYLFYSMNKERKRMHLWLHNPMSTVGLLSAKIITSFVYLMITFTITLIILAVLLPTFTDEFGPHAIFNMVGLFAVILLSNAFFMAMVFLLLWSIFITLSNKMGYFLSFVLTFLFFLILSGIYNLIMDLSFIETLTHWGEIQFKDIFVNVSFNYEFKDIAHTEADYAEASLVYIGNIVQQIIEIAILFLAACWIFDRKVEV